MTLTVGNLPVVETDGLSVILCFFALGSVVLPFASGVSPSLSAWLRFFAEGLDCLPACVFVIFGTTNGAGAGAGAALAGLREGRIVGGGGTPSAGVGGSDFRTSLIFFAPPEGVTGGGDMAEELLGPGVDAETEAVTEEELSFSVSFFVGSAGLSMMN